MFNQKSILIVFVDRLGIQLFGSNLQNIVSVQIPSTIVLDFEILSKDSLYSLIKQWVVQYQLAGSQIIFIFSENVYLEKMFVASESTQIETEILKFFDMVPYEFIWSKVYTTKLGKRALAFNKDFYDGMHQGFLLQGLPTKATIPAFALGPHEKKHTMDMDLYLYIIANLSECLKSNVLEASEAHEVISSPPSSSIESDKEKSKLPLLLSIFGVLLLALGIVAYLQFR